MGNTTEALANRLGIKPQTSVRACAARGAISERDRARCPTAGCGGRTVHSSASRSAKKMMRRLPQHEGQK